MKSFRVANNLTSTSGYNDRACRGPIGRDNADDDRCWTIAKRAALRLIGSTRDPPALFGCFDPHRRAPPQHSGAGAHGQLEQAAPREVDDHLMVPQSLAALHQPEIPYQAIVAAAHARQAAVLKASHERRECTADRFRQILTAPNQKPPAGHCRRFGRLSMTLRAIIQCVGYSVYSLVDQLSK